MSTNGNDFSETVASNFTNSTYICKASIIINVHYVSERERNGSRVGKMPAVMSKVHAGGIYQYLPVFTGAYRYLSAFTDIAGFCYCFLLLAQN